MRTSRRTRGGWAPSPGCWPRVPRWAWDSSVAGLTGANGSPVVAVGELQIDFTPPWLKNFAIAEFGADDKLVLVSGILVVLAIFAAVIGAAATRRMAYGMAGLGVFAVVGLTAAATRPTATFTSLLPTLAATAAAVAVLRLLDSAAASPAAPAPRRAATFDPACSPPTRRSRLSPAAVERTAARRRSSPDASYRPPAPQFPRGRRGDRGHRGRGRAGGAPAGRAEQRGQRAAVAAHPRAHGRHADAAVRRELRHTGALAVHHAQQQLLPGGHRARSAAGRPVELAAADPRHGRTARSRSASTSCSSGR